MFLFGVVSCAYLALGDVVPEKCKYDPARDEFPGGKFPENFGWSLATAAYQVIKIFHLIVKQNLTQ